MYVQTNKGISAIFFLEFLKQVPLGLKHVAHMVWNLEQSCLLRLHGMCFFVGHCLLCSNCLSINP